MKICEIKIIITATLAAFFLSLPAYAATYYVDGSAGNDSNPGSIDKPWKTIHKANTTLVAGDTVYLRGGTYNVGTHYGSTDTRGIMPENSGSSEKARITYSTYQDEVVNLVGQGDSGVNSVGIWIHGKQYITVTGRKLGMLNSRNMAKHLLLGPWAANPLKGETSYNEIAYLHTKDSCKNAANCSWSGNVVGRWSSYNHVHHCKFEKHGYMEPKNSGNEGDLFHLGIESADADNKTARFTVIENNEFLHGGHATFSWFGHHNIVRNNYFHNDAWYTYPGLEGKYGYRNIIGDGIPGYVGHNVFEGNRIGHAAPNYTWENKPYYWGGTGMKLCHPYNILRYNSWFNNASSALSFSWYPPNAIAAGDHTHAYNNTFYRNGWYQKLPGKDLMYVVPINFGYTGNNKWVASYASILKNNLFYDNANTHLNKSVWASGNSSPISYITDPEKMNVTLENNFNSEAGQNTDPLFINADLGNLTSWTTPNLNLRDGSPAIDGGSALTNAKGSGSNSTVLVVSDAYYFQDGSFGSASGCDASKWPAGVDIQADWIAIGTASNSVEISEINYSTNTIKLASATSWKEDAPVWLYKKSDGQVVLNGAAPDYGANEYTVAPSAPGNLRLR